MVPAPEHARLDAVFTRTRELFELPEGIVYLDGNSLGPLTHAARARVAETVSAQWGEMLIGGWNQCGWMDLPAAVGDRIAAIVGAAPGTVMAGESTSVCLHKALSAALEMRAERRVVLTDSGNFPTDLYVAQELLRWLGQGHELVGLRPELVAYAIDESIAVVMLTEVDYRTARLHDMADITRRAHEAGALVIWDLSHSAGAVPIDLTGADADFAVGCGYKYLNGGPGAPAYIYVAPRHADRARPSLVGWMGHESPFAFDLDYRPARGVTRMRAGTPPIISMASLHAALGVWDGISMADVRARSIELSESFIAEVERRCPELELASPRDRHARGSHVSFHFAEGYAAIQALIARGVIGDFRAPDLMRFGFAPLYVTPADVVAAAETLEAVLRDRAWDRPEFTSRHAVT